MLPISTLKKIIKDCFPEQEPDPMRIISVPFNSRHDWLKNISQNLAELNRIECRLRALNEAKTEFAMGIYIWGPSSRRNPHDYYQIRFESISDIEGLWLYDAQRRRGKIRIDPVPVNNVEQLQQFVEQVKTRQDRNHLLELRKQKVASLQQTGLTARLKELGRIHDFSFAISETTREVRLSIRIKGRKRGFHFSFPKGKLGDVIEQIPDLISTLENLQSLGVNFRSENKRLRLQQGEWIIPPPKSRSNKPAQPS